MSKSLFVSDLALVSAFHLVLEDNIDVSTTALLKAGWEGHLTLEISNCTSLFNKIYANEGICQLLFYEGDPCEVSYLERKGKYNKQPYKVVLSKV